MGEGWALVSFHLLFADLEKGELMGDVQSRMARVVTWSP